MIDTIWSSCRAGSRPRRGGVEHGTDPWTLASEQGLKHCEESVPRLYDATSALARSRCITANVQGTFESQDDRAP
jgi:hypothetical protein